MRVDAVRPANINVTRSFGPTGSHVVSFPQGPVLYLYLIQNKRNPRTDRRASHRRVAVIHGAIEYDHISCTQVASDVVLWENELAPRKFSGNDHNAVRVKPVVVTVYSCPETFIHCQRIEYRSREDAIPFASEC